MSRGVRVYLVGAVLLVALAGCGRWFAEREPWRREAEMACIKSGSVRESPELVRIEPISGPGVCGADFPIKVSALGDSPAIGYAEDLRPPGSIPNVQPRWPISEPRDPPAYDPRPPTYGPRYAPPAYEPRTQPADTRYQPRGSPRVNFPGASGASPSTGAPISLSPPGIEPPAGAPGNAHRLPSANPPPRPGYGWRGPPSPPPAAADDDNEEIAEDDLPPQAPASSRKPGFNRPAPSYRPAPAATPVPLGKRSLEVAASGPAAVSPAATLSCPLVSALDQWVAAAVQPAARKWFGQPVAEIRQISAYSCRGMNGQPGARISEHAFGNALDIAAFTLADGRKISVKDGWRGSPEEQGFLHDVQSAACDQFTTVLAPGSNRFHYDHIHVDLMRRASGRSICEPGAIPGEVAAARARNPRGYAGKDGVTGSIAPSKTASAGKPRLLFRPDAEDDWIEEEPGDNTR
jgi:hypothetical protein